MSESIATNNGLDDKHPSKELNEYNTIQHNRSTELLYESVSLKTAITKHKYLDFVSNKLA